MCLLPLLLLIEIQPAVVNTTPSRFGLWDGTLLSSLPPGRGSLQTCSFSFLWLYQISGLGTVLSPNVFALLQEVLCLPGNRCNIYLWKCVALCEDCLCHLSRVWAASSGFMLPGSCISTVSTAKKYAWSVPTLIRDTGFSFLHRDVFKTFAHPFSLEELRGVGGCPKLEMGLSPILPCHKFWSATSLRNLGTRSCLNSSLQLLT